MLVRAEQSSHWYLPDATPFYEVPCKSRPGEMRKATITDAREARAFPSVTTIISIVAKPQLIAWKIEQGILAALTLPPKPNEPEDAYLKRVANDAAATSRKAAGLGTEFHDYADEYDLMGVIPVTDGPRPMDPRIPAMIGGYAVWSRKHIRSVVECERPVVCALGYGGRLDRILTAIEGQRVLADIKTQSTKQGQKIRVYPEYGMQLAAYAQARGEPNSTLLWNIVVSTTEMGRVECYDWTEQRKQSWQRFVLAMALWKQMNNYFPERSVEDEHGTEPVTG